MTYRFECDRCGADIKDGVTVTVIPSLDPGPVVRGESVEHLCSDCRDEFDRFLDSD